MSRLSGAISSEDTIHELLTAEQVKAVSNSVACLHTQYCDIEIKSDSTASEKPINRKKSKHRKVSAKEKLAGKERRKGSPVYEPVQLIAEIEDVIMETERAIESWPIPIPGHKDVYEGYPLQQKKTILGLLKGRIDTIQSSIEAAKSFIDKANLGL
jgi:hypothetical protein